MGYDRRMAHRGGTFPRPRSTTWARAVNVTAQGANGNYSTLDLLGPFKTSGGQQQGVTVTRIHLDFIVTSAVAASDSFSWGILKGQDADVGLNIAGAPTPVTHPYEDWMMWRTEVACAGVNTQYWELSNHLCMDIKSQRRLEELQETLNLVILRNSVAAASLATTVVTSVLLKLP
jgi:hypothetical protein